MDRREFLQSAFASALFRSFPGIGTASRLLGAEFQPAEENTNWASVAARSTVQASSHVADPPWGYPPANAIGDDLMNALVVFAQVMQIGSFIAAGIISSFTS